MSADMSHISSSARNDTSIPLPRKVVKNSTVISLSKQLIFKGLHDIHFINTHDTTECLHKKNWQRLKNKFNFHFCFVDVHHSWAEQNPFTIAKIVFLASTIENDKEKEKLKNVCTSASYNEGSIKEKLSIHCFN